MKAVIDGQLIGIRRWTEWRDDNECFELYNIETGECASFPGVKKDFEAYLRRINKEARQVSVPAK